MGNSVSALFTVIEQSAKKLGIDPDRASEILQTTILDKYPDDFLREAREDHAKLRAGIEGQLNAYLLSPEDTACCIRDYVASLGHAGQDIVKEFFKWLSCADSFSIPPGEHESWAPKWWRNAKAYEKLVKMERLALHERGLRNMTAQQKERRQANGLT